MKILDKTVDIVDINMSRASVQIMASSARNVEGATTLRRNVCQTVEKWLKRMIAHLLVE